MVITTVAEPETRSLPFPSCKNENGDPPNVKPGLPGLFHCTLQSQRDFYNGTTAWQRCGCGKDPLWQRAGVILQVTQKDGNLP